MAVQYNKDNGWSSGWIDSLKKNVVNTTQEIDTLFDKINTGKVSLNGITVTDKFFDVHNITTQKDDLEDFFNTFYKGGDVAKEYQKYMIQNGKATTQFGGFVKKAGTAVKSFLASMGSMIAMWAISEVIGYIATYNQRLEESRQEMIEAGKEASQLTKDLDGLVEQYRKLGEDGKLDNSDREQARNIQEQINSLLGDEVHYIDLSNGNYEHQLDLLRKIQHQKANDNYSTITDAKNAADESLRSKGVGTVGAGFNEKINGEWETDAIKKLLDKEGFSEYIDETLGGFNVGNYYNNSAEDFIKSYNDMIELRTKLSKSYSDEIKEGGKLHDFYKNLDQKIKDMTDAVTKYQDALDDYDINQAVIQFNETDFGGVKGALIDTKEEMESWAKAMVESDDISDGIKENLIGLAKTYYPELSDAINESVQAHYKEKYAKAGSSSEIGNHIKNLDAEADQCGLTKKAYIELISQEILFNNNNLNVTQKISALQQLAYQAGITADKMRQALMFDSLQKAYDVETHGIEAAYRAGRITKEQRDARKAQILSELNSSLYEGYEDSPGGDTPPYTPSGGDKGSSKDNTPDYEDPTNAIINRINLRSKELEKQEQSIEDALEIAEIENDYKKQILSTNDLITTRKKRVDELNVANSELHQMAEDLRNNTPQWDEEEWFDSLGNATEAYNTLYNNSSKEEQEKLKTHFEKISKIKEAWVANDEELVELNKQLLQDAENLNDIYETIANTTIDSINHQIDLNINNYGEDFNNNAYYKQIQEIAHAEAERLRALDPEKYKEQIREWQNVWWDAQNEMLDYNESVIDDFLNELQEKLDKEYDIHISRLNSESSLLSSHYGVLNAINEEQHNLNKELREAETIGARMNEQERETLLTKQEHTRLTGKLEEVMEGINVLQLNYQHDLETATEDTIEEITNHYERQYELKMKEYEIVRAELDLMRKKQILENVENEKSVRTWNGSNWVYEANLQDVLDAQEELANAEYELAKAKTEEAQQLELNALDANADALQTEKNRLATAIDEMAEKMEGSGKEITNMLKTIAETDLPTFDAIIQAFGDTLKNSFGISDETIQSYRQSGQNSGGKSLLDEMKDNSVKWHAASKDEQGRLAERNQYIGDLLGLDYEESTGRWKKPDGTYAYAKGTKGAHKGLGLFDEEGLGSEFILTKDGILTQFQGGEHVFSSEMADRLWAMAQNNVIPYNIVQPDIGRLIPIEDRVNNAISNISNAFGDTYTIKNIQLSEEEGGTLKGFINFLKRKI